MIRMCLAITAVLVSGVGQTASGFDGYILFGAYGASSTYLIDGKDDTVCSWNHANLVNNLNGYSCYLLENGNLLRSSQTNKKVASSAAPKQGRISELDAKGNELWSYELADPTYMLHHDCKVMPNGNLLVVSFVHTLAADAIKKGLDSAFFSSDTVEEEEEDPFDFGWSTAVTTAETEKILEIKPDKTGGNNHQIVWEWNILDHVVPKAQAAQHPEKFSGGLGMIWSGQWVHLNGIDYNPTKDLILFSSRLFSEVYVIDHSTTTQQAATGSGGTYNKGGDLLYRWGRSKNYGIPGDSISTLHCPTWIPDGYTNAGNIMFFHNNAANVVTSGFASIKKLGNSQVIEITPPADFKCTANSAFGPATPTWKYAPANVDSMFSQSMSSAIRMKNGNTIVHEAYTTAKSGGKGGFGTSGGSHIHEVTPENLVIKTIELKTNAAKIMYYEKDYIGVKKLIENMSIANKISRLNANRSYINVKYNALMHALCFSNVANAEISLYSLQGKKIASIRPDASIFTFTTKALSKGAYIVKITNAGGLVTTQQFNVL